MTLSFLQACRAKQSGAISWDEYIHTLMARSAGAKHEDDNSRDMYAVIPRTDPFAYSVWCWSGKVENINDTSPLEAVFKAYRHNTVDDVEEKLSVLDGMPAEGVKKSLALLALLERQAGVLKLCLDQGGFPVEDHFRIEADRVNAEKDPETFNTLEQSEFRRLHPKRTWIAPQPGGGIGAPPGREAVFDKGGKLPVDW